MVRSLNLKKQFNKGNEAVSEETAVQQQEVASGTTLDANPEEHARQVFDKLREQEEAKVAQGMGEPEKTYNKEFHHTFKEDVEAVLMESRGVAYSVNTWYKDSGNPFSQEVVNQWFIDGAINELGLSFKFGYTQSWDARTKSMGNKGASYYSVKVSNGFFETIFNFKANKDYFASLNTDVKWKDGKNVPQYVNYVKKEGSKYPEKVADYNNVYSTSLLRAVLLIADKVFVDLYEGQYIEG